MSVVFIAVVAAAGFAATVDLTVWLIHLSRRDRCGCGHSLAFHDAPNGGCHIKIRRRYYGTSMQFFEDVTCECRQYVGQSRAGERRLKAVA